MRRSFIAGLSSLFGIEKATSQEAPRRFPPVPKWHPSFAQPLDRVADRISYYANGKNDFVVFRNGTCVILRDSPSDKEAEAFALKALSEIFYAHPDMTPTPMDDGNVLVRYNRPAANVVLHDIAQAHWAEIEARHQDGLTTSEVLITPLGPNKFDALGKQALLGRAYMFLDAQKPELVTIKRHK
jgi:hypothetical protein